MHLSSGVYKITVSTGGISYSGTPTVTISGGGGTGAAAVAQMNGTAVQAIAISNAGTGYTSQPTVSVTGGGGTGAAATASVLSYSATRPISMFKGRINDMYGVDGGGRGFRWDGDTPYIEAIGLSPPPTPTVTSSTSGQVYSIGAVQMVDGGAGYASEPDVVFTGGSATTAASARARVSQGRVIGVVINNPGAGYQTTPTVSFVGGIGGSAQFGVGVQGELQSIEVSNGGSNYSTPPTVIFNNTQGLTGVNAVATVLDGKVTRVEVLAGGTGATASGMTVSFTHATGTGAAAVANMAFRVSSVTATSGGTGYYTPPVVSVIQGPADTSAIRAAALTSSVTNGSVSAVTVISGGEYGIPPTAKIADTSAKAQASISKTVRGAYKFAIRYIDDTPESQGGPIPSDISELTEVGVDGGAQSFTWVWSNAGAEARAHAVELWRTTADQAVVLYRVAKLSKSGGVLPVGPYVESLTDRELIDPTRTDYGLLPITLPSGQLNARRFGVPPQNMAVACMFQDRAWYGVDTTGAKPNSLYYSEIDEPESVPSENELILQENAGETDALVALIPFGSSLLMAQSRHIYKLTYVAQPIIDASIILSAYRGVLNNRCWGIMGGVAFLVDSYGMYSYAPEEEPVSVAIDSLWRDGTIDFSKSDKFYVQCDPAVRVVRFFYMRATDTGYPSRALCYCTATKAWWEEAYAQQLPHATVATIGARQKPLFGGQVGGFLTQSGIVDATTSGSSAGVEYQYRTPPMRLVNEPDRSVSVLYKPTLTASTLTAQLHYNNSESARPNAIAADRGDGFVASQSGGVSIDMKKTRSSLGDANGHARAAYAGRMDDRSGGADRHIAVALSGTQSGTTSSDAVVLHAVTVGGVS